MTSADGARWPCHLCRQFAAADWQEYSPIPDRTAPCFVNSGAENPVARIVSNQITRTIEPRIVAPPPEPRADRYRLPAPSPAKPWPRRWRARRCLFPGRARAFGRPRLQHIIEQQQAAARGGRGGRCRTPAAASISMPSLVGRDARAIMLAMHDEIARPRPGRVLRAWP